MGSKQSGQTNSSQTYSPPPAVMQNYTQVTNQAQNVAATPYQAYGGPLVAGINNQQNTGIAGVNSAANIQTPYNAGATGLAAASSGAIDPTQYSAQQLQQYENPYQNDVINATEAQINNQNQQQAAALQGNAISAGAFGGDRAGVAQAALAGQQDIANNATLANLNTSNFQNAQNQFTTQQGVNLGAQQNTAARQLAASQQIGNLGAAAQSEGLAGANAQVNAGTLQQATQQAQDTAGYNQFLQQQAYPFQTTGWLANIVEGIGSQSGGTTTGQQTQQSGNGLSSVAGGLLGLASFLKDGGRVNGDEIRIPRKAAGGGLSPYDGALDPNGALGGGSWVTPANLAVGHTAPAGMSGGSGAQQSPTQSAMSGMKNMQGLGNAFQNSSLGDTVGDFIQDLPGLFARGGAVRHYDAGGDVSPDALWADADNPHGTGPALQPNDVAAAHPLAVAASLPTPEAAMAARYASGQMPAPQQDGLTPDQKLAVAMGAPTPASGNTPPPATPGPVGLAALDAARAAGLAKLQTAMGGSNAPTDPNAIYGSLDATGVGGGSAPLPPSRPAGLGVTPQTLDAAAPGGLGTATAGPPTQLPGGGLVAKVPTWKDVQADNAAGTADIASRDGSQNYYSSVGEGDDYQKYLAAKNATAPAANVPYNPARADAAIKSIESGGDYGAVGPATASGDHAYGAHQVMGANIPAWTAKWVGQAMTPAQFLADPKAQDAVFQGQFGSYVKQYGNVGDAASAWFTGRPLTSQTAGLKDSLGTSDNAYVNKFLSAYTGAPANAPASQAIAGATGGRGGAQPGLTSGSYSVPGLGGASSYNGPPLTADSPVASTDARPQPDQGGGLLGLHFSDAARQGMLAAGLGMMGGTSMNPWTNIGQGGLGGLKQYNDARKLQSEIGLQGAQTGLAGAHAGLAGAQTLGSLTDTQGKEIENQIRAKQRDLMLGILDTHAASGAQKADAVEKGVTAPTVTAPTIAGGTPPAQNAQAHTPDQVDPRSDPMALRAEADRLSLGGPMFKDRADRMYAQAAAIMSGEQQVQFSDGTTGYYPGVAEAKARQAAATKEAEVGPSVDTAAGTKNFETQNALKTQTAAEAADGQNMLGQAMALRDRMFDPKTGQPVVNSGPYGAKINGIAAAMKQLGIGDGVIQSLTHTDPNNAQEVEKLRTALGSEAARADLGGSQIRVAEWQRFLQTTPGADLLPGAYKFILDNVIIPKAQQQIQQYDAIKDLDPKKDNIQGALFQYRNNHPSYAGPPPASPTERVKNGIYSNPAGQRARWSGTGWVPIQ